MSDEKEVAFAEWQKLDLRVARIREVKDHPQADKLYLLRVDLGREERCLVAGLKPYYEKEELEKLARKSLLSWQKYCSCGTVSTKARKGVI